MGAYQVLDAAIARMQNVIYKLQEFAATDLELKTERAFQAMEEKVSWQMWQGHTQGLGLGSKGIFILVAHALNAGGDMVKSLAPLIDGVTQTATAYLSARMSEPSFKEQRFLANPANQIKQFREMGNQFEQARKEAQQDRKKLIEAATSVSR